MADDLILCEDIELPEGNLREVYIGPCGVYVLSAPASNAEELYIALRKLFGTSRFKVYISESGEYLPSTGGFTDYANDEELSASISEYVYSGPAYFDSELREKIYSDLVSISNRNRKVYKDTNGKVFIYKNGELKEASPHSSNLNYVLTLFGGVFGIHQIALQKYGLGLLYLLTGGGFLVGWLMDILFLFLGIQKDKQKRYLQPLDHKFRKLLLLPCGFVMGIFLFNLYFQTSQALGQSADLYFNGQVQSLNPTWFQNLYNNLTYYAELLSQ